jgi:predicted acylesterase/phospholipase RssA
LGHPVEQLRSVVFFQALEDIGILKKVKRIAGTSVGSLTALVLALGGTSVDIAVETLENMATLTQGNLRGAFVNEYRQQTAIEPQ